MANLTKFVYYAGFYNILLAIAIATPAITSLLGIPMDPALGLLFGGFLLFTAVIQIFGSRDLKTYGWAIFWEGILRWIGTAVLIPYGLFGHLGIMSGLMGAGDFLIGAIFLIVLPKVIGKRPADLCMGR